MSYNPKKIDPSIDSASEEMHTAVNKVLDLMEERGHVVPRQQPKNLQKLMDHVRVILCNLIGGRWVSFRLAKDGYKRSAQLTAGLKRDRSKRSEGFQFTSPNVRKVVFFLQGEGFIEIVKGFSYPGETGKVSIMRATDKLKELVPPKVETHQDATGMALVVMKGKKVNGKRRVCKTPQTGKVREMEENLLLINKVIRDAKIELDSGGFDLTQRHLYRSFLDRRLDRGGRFFGGFWETLHKKIRRRLLINGMPVWEFDFSEVQPNILYGMVGIAPPEGGAYRPPDYRPEYRGLIKAFFLRMLNNASTRYAILSMQKNPPKPEDIPDGVDLHDWQYMFELAGAIKAHNQPIIKFLDGPKGIADTLQWHDSEIMERVLVHFAEQGIPALPVHDSLIVTLDNAWECIDAMQAAFKERFRQDIRVDGTMLEGILDALDRAPRKPQFVALAHQVALELADAIAHLFPGNKDIYQAVKQHLEENPV